MRQNFDINVHREASIIQNKEKLIMLVHSLKKENKELVVKKNLLETELSPNYIT